MKNFKYILENLKKYKLRYVIATIFLGVSVFINMQLIKILGNTIDMLNNTYYLKDDIQINIKSIIIYSVCYAVLIMIWRPLIYTGAKKIKRDLHEKVYKHLCSVPYEIIMTKSSGSLIAYLHNDIEFIEDLLSDKYTIIFTAIFTWIISIVYMLIGINLKLAIIAIVITACGVGIATLITYNMTKQYDEARDLQLKNASKIRQIVSGIKTIKRFNKIKECVENFRKHAFELEKKDIEVIKAKSLSQFAIDMYLQLAYGFVLVYAGTLVISRQITIGKFVEFASYFTLLNAQTLNFSKIIPEIKQISVSIYKIRKFMKIKEETDDREKIELNAEKLELKKLTANPYIEEGIDKNILTDISFKLLKGESLGIVGKLGSGKSTIVSLISEIYNVKDNMIFVDDIDINKISKESVLNKVEIIGEDNTIIEDTIYNNITLYNSIYSKEDVEEACKKVYLHEQIQRLPQGYDTVIGQNGVYLTVGQSQRLRIARSFLTKRKIIIFDECFSKIEANMCKEIIENIREDLKDTILIIITNNVNNIKWCTNIIVMEDGKIVERGTHKKLIREDSIYRKTYDLQKNVNGGL